MRGSSHVVRPLIEDLGRYVQGYLIGKGCNPQDAAELSQSVLLKVHMNRNKFDPAQKLRPWIATIAMRTLIDFWRSSKRSQTVEITDEIRDFDQSTNPETAVTSKIQIEKVEKKLNQLKPIDQRIVDLYACEGKTMREIGAETGLTALAVKLRLFRARRFLRSTASM